MVLACEHECFKIKGVIESSCAWHHLVGSESPGRPGEALVKKQLQSQWNHHDTRYNQDFKIHAKGSGWCEVELP